MLHILVVVAERGKQKQILVNTSSHERGSLIPPLTFD